MTREEDRIIREALAILRKRIRKPDTYLSKPEAVADYLMLRLAEQPFETFGYVWLNVRHGVIKVELPFRGTIDGASVHPREVVRDAMVCNAAAVIFVHNHPSGISDPSRADVRITARLKSALELIDVRVLDHLIIGAGEYTSLAERGLL